MQTKFVCVLTCAPEAMYNPPKIKQPCKNEKNQYLCKQFCKIIYPSIKMQMDNSQQIDLAAECVKTLIAQDPYLQNKEVLYDKLNCITNEQIKKYLSINYVVVKDKEKAKILI